MTFAFSLRMSTETSIGLGRCRQMFHTADGRQGVLPGAAWESLARLLVLLVAQPRSGFFRSLHAGQ
jgi:hypothetical protein